MASHAGSAGQALEAAVDAMRAAGVEDPRLDAELLLSEATGWERASLVAEPEASVTGGAGRAFGEMVRRRLRREPVAYILGRKGFRGIELAVDGRVLIPRPETELLVEVALERRPSNLLDLGTGSGAIALAVADELPDCVVTATDTSAAALEVARANARRLGFAERVRFLDGSLPADGDFDVILANLPYVAESDWTSLQPEVTHWEPREALLAGRDGLDAYRVLFAERGRAWTRMAGQSSTAPLAVAVEVGESQAQALAGMMSAAGFNAIETRRDLAGIERVVIGERRAP